MRMIAFALMTLLSLPFQVLADKDLQIIDPRPGSAAAVVVVDSVPLVHTTQLTDSGKGSVEDRLRRSFKELDDLLKQADSSPDRLVKLNFVVASDKARADINAFLAQRFAGAHRPAVSFVSSRLPNPDSLFAIDAVAAGTRRAKWKKAEHGGLDEKGDGPRFTLLPPGTRVFVSGQAVPGKDLAEATRKTLEELQDTLKSLRLDKSAVVQLKVFLRPMDHSEAVRQEALRFFGKGKMPPLVFIEWRSSLPVEIELIAWGGPERAGVPIEYLTPPGLKASPVYSRVARINHGRLIFLSSFVGKPGDGPAAEITDIFEQMGKTLSEAGSDYRHLAKATYYVTTSEAVKMMGKLRPRYYDPKRPPAASLAVVGGTGQAGKTVTLDMIAVPSPRLKLNEYGPAERGHGLTEELLKEGWIALYDGKTDFGWSDAKVVEGVGLKAGTSLMPLGPGRLSAEVAMPGKLVWGEKSVRLGADAVDHAGPEAKQVKLREGLTVKRLLFKPTKLTSLLERNDLSGWKAINHPRLPRDQTPTWTMTEGILKAVGGPGCLEYQRKQFENFVLQLEVRTRLRQANGGVFFRAMPGSFMNGYEAQIYNRCHDRDTRKPWTWATGAIDDRVNTRRLLSRDGEWFHYTIIAQGKRIATWVNGYQTVDFLDEREEHENARLGMRNKAGTLQLQAHDAATEIEFRNIRVADWK